LAYGDDAKDGRPNATTHRHVHAADLSIYLLTILPQLWLCITLHKIFLVFCNFIRTSDNPCRRSRKLRLPKTKAMMTPKDLLDTLLGYLGFVVDIEETTNEGGNPTLQIYTEESRRLIGRNGETLEAIQFLLNRLLQAKDNDAEKVIVDCEHYRSMREDRIVQRCVSWLSACASPAVRFSLNR